MSAEIDIYNMSLGHLGISQTVSSVTETSAEARALKRFYQTALDKILRSAGLPISRKFKTLGLVEADPTSEWDFSYRYPNDVLFLRRIFSGARNDSEDSEVPYLIGQDDAGLLLYCDLDDVEIEYTCKCTNTAVLPADLVLTLSYLLAHLAGPALSKGDMRPADRAYKLYEMEYGKMIVNAMSEEKPDRPVVDSFTRSRT